jgi:hypothetical protein
MSGDHGEEMLERFGLFRDPDVGLVDAETGEVYPETLQSDIQSATIGTHRILSNRAAIDRLEEQKRALEKEIKQRKDRDEYLETLYMPALKAVAQIEIEKSKRQSAMIGYATIGWRTTRPSAKPLPGAAAYCLHCAPQAVKATVHLDKLGEENAKRLALILRDMAGNIGVALEVRSSLVPKDALNPSYFEINPGGEQDWYIR